VPGDFTALVSGGLNASCPVSIITGLSRRLSCACEVLGRVPMPMGPELAKEPSVCSPWECLNSANTGVQLAAQ